MVFKVIENAINIFYEVNQFLPPYNIRTTLALVSG
jgi:hypothetical protein